MWVRGVRPMAAPSAGIVVRRIPAGIRRPGPPGGSGVFGGTPALGGLGAFCLWGGVRGWWSHLAKVGVAPPVSGGRRGDRQRGWPGCTPLGRSATPGAAGVDGAWPSPRSWACTFTPAGGRRPGLPGRRFRGGPTGLVMVNPGASIAYITDRPISVPIGVFTFVFGFVSYLVHIGYSGHAVVLILQTLELHTSPKHAGSRRGRGAWPSPRSWAFRRPHRSADPLHDWFRLLCLPGLPVRHLCLLLRPCLLPLRLRVPVRLHQLPGCRGDTSSRFALWSRGRFTPHSSGCLLLRRPLWLLLSLLFRVLVMVVVLELPLFLALGFFVVAVLGVGAAVGSRRCGRRRLEVLMVFLLLEAQTPARRCQRCGPAGPAATPAGGSRLTPRGASFFGVLCGSCCLSCSGSSSWSWCWSCRSSWSWASAW